MCEAWRAWTYDVRQLSRDLKVLGVASPGIDALALDDPPHAMVLLAAYARLDGDPEVEAKVDELARRQPPPPQHHDEDWADLLHGEWPAIAEPDDRPWTTAGTVGSFLWHLVTHYRSLCRPDGTAPPLIVQQAEGYARLHTAGRRPIDEQALELTELHDEVAYLPSGRRRWLDRRTWHAVVTAPDARYLLTLQQEGSEPSPRLVTFESEARATSSAPAPATAPVAAASVPPPPPATNTIPPPPQRAVFAGPGPSAAFDAPPPPRPMGAPLPPPPPPF